MGDAEKIAEIHCFRNPVDADREIPSQNLSPQNLLPQADPSPCLAQPPGEFVGTKRSSTAGAGL
jgi:hypothetical protein